MTTLRQAAQVVVERWDADLPSTGKHIAALRTALEASEQKPVTWTLTSTLIERETTTNGRLWFKDPVNALWSPLYAAQVEAPDIKALQAEGKGPAPCARFCEAKAFEIEIRNAAGESQVLIAERDEYQKAADDMAAAHKVERDKLTRANKDLIDWFDAVKSDYDALMAAGKLALEALEQCSEAHLDCSLEIAALKAAGVS